jgi:YXWGXW repeat-containing protein
MKEDSINIIQSRTGSSAEGAVCTDSSHGAALDSPSGTTGCSVEHRKIARGVWMRRAVVSSLIGSLLLVLAMLAAPKKSSASVGIFVSFGPPALPYYEQPPIPGPGYIWTPGYWDWDPDFGYFWVPGTWVPAPFVGAVWTPGYWGWDEDGDGYVYYPGYWGTEVGFYGGIDYGYGYPGQGYYGGQWRGDRFYYNREVTHITNINIVNVYQQRVVVNNNNVSRISYNGGSGGIDARPTSAEMAAARSRRSGPVSQQLQQQQVARNEPAQRARENHGKPEVAATMRPGEFSGNGAVRASRAGAPYKEPPRNANNGQPAGRSQPAPVERRPGANAPNPAPANPRMERRAPEQPGTEPPANRNNRRPESHPAPRESLPPEARPNAPEQPRNERPMNRNNRPPEMQRNQRESQPPQALPNEDRGRQERQAPPQNEGRHQGRNDNNPPQNRR